ncbi:MAG: 50S ribosomal protein L4 [Oscillospiraceae bacterium]|nr:50S ribosomal protein L4 [Candidatus Equicaccousia limihippi]
MPQVDVLSMTGEKVGKVKLKDALFAVEPNKAVMHMAVVNYLANQRQGTQSTLTRTEVAGGGKKPWRQKGTGHARQGSIRAPQWRHGGVALGPKPRDYSYSLNKKVKRLALKSALSDKVLTKDLIVLEELKVEEYKTKTVKNCLDAIGATGKTLIVLDSLNGFAIKSAANIAGVKTCQVGTINTYDVINADKLVVVKAAVKMLEEVYA